MEIAAALATALLFGGMTLFSAGFAPVLFRALPEAQAGAVLRAAFPPYYLFVILCALAAGALAWPADRAAAAALGVVATGAVWARQGLMPAINAARDAAVAGAPAAGARFRRLHGASVAIQLAQIVLAGWVLVRLV